MTHGDPALPEPFRLAAATCVAMTVLVSACGGGGSDSSPSGPDEDSLAPGLDPTSPTMSDDSLTEGFDGSADEPDIIVTAPATEDDLVVGGGGMLYRGYENVSVIQPETLGESGGRDTVPEEIEFDPGEIDPELRVERLFVVRQADDFSQEGNRAALVGIVTNLSDVPQCNFLIQGESVTLNDGSVLDAPLGPLFAEVAGAYGDGTVFMPSDCVLPGTSAYFFVDEARATIPSADPSDPLTSSLRRLTLGEIRSVSFESFQATAIRNLDFEPGVVDARIAENGIGISIFNTGDFDLELTDVSIFAIDEAGRPLWVRPYTVNDLREELAPGDFEALFFSDTPAGTDRYLVTIAYDDL